MELIFFGFVWNLVAVVNRATSYAASYFNFGTEMRVSSFNVSLHVLEWI